MMPEVSVIVPNYNHEKYLAKRLESIFNQTFHDFEVILLDDCSTDNSRDIIEQYRGHPKVSAVVYNQQNGGSTFKQWEKGIRLCKGKYIWIAESDDECDPDFLLTLVNMLDKSESVVLAYCQSLVIDEAGEKRGSMSEWTSDIDEDRWKIDFVNKGADECKNYLIVKTTIPNASAVVFRKDAFLNINTSTNLHLCGDWLIWSRLINEGDISFCASHLNFFRTHEETVRSAIKGRPYLLEFISVVNEILSTLTLTKQEKIDLSVKLIKYWSKFLSYKRPDIAFRFIETMFKISPKGAIELFVIVFFTGWGKRIKRNFFIRFSKK
jgi:glycosyltransferase involved in cell wall biosynthesis